MQEPEVAESSGDDGRVEMVRRCPRCKGFLHVTMDTRERELEFSEAEPPEPGPLEEEVPPITADLVTMTGAFYTMLIKDMKYLVGVQCTPEEVEAYLRRAASYAVLQARQQAREQFEAQLAHVALETPVTLVGPVYSAPLPEGVACRGGGEAGPPPALGGDPWGDALRKGG